MGRPVTVNKHSFRISVAEMAYSVRWGHRGKGRAAGRNGTHLPSYISSLEGASHDSRWRKTPPTLTRNHSPIYDELLAAGADVVTLGNHSWNRKEAIQFIDECPRLVRPINYLAGAPGKGAVLIDVKNGRRALVINALGRLFMEPVEDPFGRIGAELDANPLARAVEATSSTFIARLPAKNAPPDIFPATDAQDLCCRNPHAHAERGRQDPAREEQPS